MSQSVPFFKPWAVISGTMIPLDAFNITNGAYGSTGRATFTTSIAVLVALKIDLIALTSAKASEIEVDVYMQENSTSPVKIFGGEYIFCQWDYDAGQVEMHARDWSGVLIDQKKVLVSVAMAAETVVAPLEPGFVGQTLDGSYAAYPGSSAPAAPAAPTQNSSAFSISTQNQLLSTLITNIANSYGLTPVLNLQQGNNPTIGDIYGSDDTIYTPIPQSLWTILTQLALDTGYEIYTTPNKQLVFGTPGAGLPTSTLTYNTNTIPKHALVCNKLILSHNPRRNSTFRVLVISYDPAKSQTTLGRATSVGSDLAGAAGLKAGIASGSAAVSTDSTLASFEQTVGKIPLYTFHLDGLTTAQASAKAYAIAQDVAKREYTIGVEIDGLSSLLPTQKLLLTGNVDSHFLGQTYYAISYTHKFKMPMKGHALDAGYTTAIQGLNFPISGQGLPSGSADEG